jgi:hypothetical protein
MRPPPSSTSACAYIPQAQILRRCCVIASTSSQASCATCNRKLAPFARGHPYSERPTVSSQPSITASGRRHGTPHLSHKRLKSHVAARDLAGPGTELRAGRRRFNPRRVVCIHVVPADPSSFPWYYDVCAKNKVAGHSLRQSMRVAVDSATGSGGHTNAQVNSFWTLDQAK